MRQCGHRVTCEMNEKLKRTITQGVKKESEQVKLLVPGGNCNRENWLNMNNLYYPQSLGTYELKRMA